MKAGPCQTSALAAVSMQALGHMGLRISSPPLEDYNSDGILILLYDKLIVEKRGCEDLLMEDESLQNSISIAISEMER